VAYSQSSSQQLCRLRAVLEILPFTVRRASYFFFGTNFRIAFFDTRSAVCWDKREDDDGGTQCVLLYRIMLWLSLLWCCVFIFIFVVFWCACCATGVACCAHTCVVGNVGVCGCGSMCGSDHCLYSQLYYRRLKLYHVILKNMHKTKWVTESKYNTTCSPHSILSRWRENM
jgi:hypothetical protein